MIWFIATCKYCGNKWEFYITSAHHLGSATCAKCGETKLLTIKAVDTNEDKIDYYKGSPPFSKPTSITDGSNTRDEPKKTWYWDSQPTKSSTSENS